MAQYKQSAKQMLSDAKLTEDARREKSNLLLDEKNTKLKKVY